MILTVATAVLSGCVVAAVGAGIGAVKYGNAKHRDAYANYRTEAEKNNTDREKSGLKPVKILTFDEWVKGKENTATREK
jgi:fructose-1,6-bisphosphatase/sedoheptulose 1,7-bisphosphatase-like protein